MHTESDIANHALSRFCEHRVGSIGEASPAGKVILTHYHQARQEALCAARWPFAIKRLTLPQLTAVDGWDYAYQLPDDFLRPIAVNDIDAEDEPEPSWEIEGRSLLTDEDECNLRYIYDCTDPNLMTPLFRSAFADLLAARIAPSIMGDAGAGVSFLEVYETTVKRAKSRDENQDTRRSVPLENDSRLIASRYSYGSTR